MKTPHQITAVLIGLSALYSSNATRAEAVKAQSPEAITKPVRFDRASYPKNSHLLTLEARLREVVLSVQPDANIEFVAHYLVVHYRSEKFRTHLTNSLSMISIETSQQFPDTFSEFLLYLSVGNDVMYYRPVNAPHYKPETFGTTLTNRYDLKILPDFRLGGDVPDVPYGHWAYKEYDKLVKYDLLPNRYPEGVHLEPSRLMTRYEFAVAMARLHDRSAGEVLGDSDMKNATIALQKEFAPELSALKLKLDPSKPVLNGQAWQPRHEHLSLRFSYGKGVDAGLVERIKQVISDYAAANYKSSKVSDNAIQSQQTAG